MQPPTKDQSRKSSPPTTSPVVNAMAGGKCKSAAAKRSRGRHTASPYIRTDANRRPSRPRRKPAEICKDVREAKGDQSVPLTQLTYGSERTNGSHIEVVRTEAFSPALSALVMATVVGHREAVGPSTSQQPPHDHQNGLYSSPLMLMDPFSAHQAPQLQHPMQSSVSTDLMSQDQPVTTNARVQAVSSHHATPPSHAPCPLLPRHTPQPYLPSALSAVNPPHSSSSMRFTPSRPSFLVRSLSWVQHPLTPFTGHAISTHASNTGPVVQCLQAPGQRRHTMDYPPPIRMSDP